jgi:4'-phosphopantetheinyl transferase
VSDPDDIVPGADVWLVAVPAAPADVAAALAVLDPPEHQRAAAFARPEDRDRFVASRAALRAVVGRRLRLPPSAVQFAREPCPRCGGPHGRPAVLGPGSGLSISLSRTAGLVACAVADRPVGVDVESLDRPVTADDLAYALHPAEQARISSVSPPSARRAALLRCWVRKEAYLKGLGIGLGDDPASVDVGPGPEGPDGWSVVDVEAGPRHLAAVALAGVAPVRTHRADLAALLP